MDPKYVITLVHGTFARGASWTREGSLLHQELRNELRGDVVFKLFQWGVFNNSPRSRDKATRNLQKSLQETINAYPDALQVVIGHSHGGNVALQALKDPGLSLSVSAVVCLATPFMAARERDLKFEIDLVSFVILAIPLWLVTILISWIVQLVYGIVADSFLSGSYWINVFVLVVCLGFLLFQVIPGVFDMWRSSIQWLSEKIILRISRVQKIISARYRMPSYPSYQILSVPASGDEVNAWLKLLSFPVSALFWIVQPIGFSVNVIIVLVMFIKTFGPAIWHIRQDIAEKLLLSGLGGGGFIGALLIILATVTILICILLTALILAGALLSLLEVLILQPIFLVLPIIFRSSPVAFGWEGLWTNWFVNLSVSLRPPFGSSQVLEPELWSAVGTGRFGLGHSVYKNPYAMKLVAAWLSKTLLQTARPKVKMGV